jgi:hypothetical protein
MYLSSILCLNFTINLADNTAETAIITKTNKDVVIIIAIWLSIVIETSTDIQDINVIEATILKLRFPFLTCLNSNARAKNKWLL